MKKSLGKLLAVFLASTMLTASFVGCSSSSNSGGESGTTDEQVTTIRYARWGLPEEMNGTKKIIEAFEKENPNIKVTLENSSWDQYWEKIQTEIASNTAPDVMLMDGGWYLSQFAPKGILEDVGALMEKDNMSKDDYFDVWKTFTYDDKVYAIPRDYNSIVLFYNKDLFDKAGIEYPSDDMTWDEAVEIGKKLTLDANGKNPTEAGFDKDNIAQYGLYVPFENVDATIETLIWQKGGKLFSDDGSECYIDSDESKEVFQWLNDLQYKHLVSPTYTAAQKYGEEAFPTGKFAMVYQGSWLQSSLSDADFDWDIAVAPTFDNKVYCAQSVGNAILASSEKKDAAWKLVKYFSGETGQKIMAESNDSIPVLKSVAEDFYVKQTGKPEHKQAIFDEAGSTVPYVSFPGKSDIYDAIFNISALYLTGDEDLDTMASNVLDQVQSIQSTQS